MINRNCHSYWAKIYISGPIQVAEQVIREECLKGLCVTIEPTKFIYTGGEEQGYVVGLINYPRFPTTELEIETKATELGLKLLERTHQHSVLIMTQNITKWFTMRTEN
jgi:hypothetical protein